MCARPNGGDDRRVPLGFGGITAAIGDHIAHFYRGSNQMFNVLGPYIAEGIRRGDKCVLISSPEDAAQLCEWITSQGIDADEACLKKQLVLHPGEATNTDMRALTEQIEEESLNTGYKFVRWAGDGGWALAGQVSVLEMLQWEALYDKVSSNWQILALCQFDLMKFSGDVVMDALRSHPLCIMGEVLVPNPFHVSPDTLLEELSERK
ncbi:MAG: MEDS domain-containing protein [bacterium]